MQPQSSELPDGFLQIMPSVPKYEMQSSSSVQRRRQPEFWEPLGFSMQRALPPPAPMHSHMSGSPNLMSQSMSLTHLTGTLQNADGGKDCAGCVLKSPRLDQTFASLPTTQPASVVTTALSQACPCKVNGTPVSRQ